MNILMIGSGGREHALIKKLLESPKCTKLYCAPGNGGISRDAETVNIGVMDKEALVAFAKEKNIDLAEVESQVMSRKAYMKKWRSLTDDEVDDELKQIALERSMLEDMAFPDSGLDEVDERLDDNQIGGDESR